MGGWSYRLETLASFSRDLPMGSGHPRAVTRQEPALEEAGNPRWGFRGIDGAGDIASEPD